MNMDAPSNSPPRNNRRWLSFSLRAGLIVMALICVWLAYETNRARRQADAVRRIQALGGVVLFDYQFDNTGARLTNGEPTAPDWLRSAVGEEYFRKVVTVDLSYGSSQRLKNGKTVTDADLELLENLPDVTTLELGNIPTITDAGLAHLAGLKHLRTLYVYRTAIEGPGLQHISGLRQLEGLDLLGTAVSDEGLAHLRGLPRLRWVGLSATRITDEGLHHLSGLRSLQEVRLVDTEVGDAGIEQLHGLTALKSLSLNHTNVTEMGVERLQAALPKCVVSPEPAQLSRKPINAALWSAGHHPSKAEVMAAVAQLGGSASVSQNHPEQPIMALTLMGSDISDESLLRLVAEMPELELLNLRDLVIGDAFAKGLPALPKLRYLSLQNCPRLTDETLPHLAEFQSLKELILRETQVTDDGVRSLSKLRNVERISLGNRVTPKALQGLQKALPNCQVTY